MWYSLMSILKALGRRCAASAPAGAGHRAAVSAGRRRAAPSPARGPRGSGPATPCPGSPQGRQRRAQLCSQRRGGPGASARLSADLFSAQPPPPARPSPRQPRADAGPPEPRAQAGGLAGQPCLFGRVRVQAPRNGIPRGPAPRNPRAPPSGPAFHNRPLGARPLHPFPRVGPVSPTLGRPLRTLSPGVSLRGAAPCTPPQHLCQCSPPPAPEPTFKDPITNTSAR